MRLRYKNQVLYFLLAVIITSLINFLITNHYKFKNLDTVLEITHCKNKPLAKSVQNRNNFWIFYNFIQAGRQFLCDKSITYATPATFPYLKNLGQLVNVWQGPISIAIYAPSTDFDNSLQTIAYLRNCENLLIKQFVTFHIFFEENYFPFEQESPLIESYKDTFNCSYGNPLEKNKISFRKEQNLTFPINLARNIAKEAAQTHFILSSDIDLYPTPNFITNFLQMVTKRSTLFLNKIPKALVLPVFEIEDNCSIPVSKTELQKMYKNKTAKFPILEKNCKYCQKLIEGNTWLNSAETEVLDVTLIGKRYNQFKFWEPFYVGTKRDPLYGEEFTWEGHYDRSSQAYTLCLLKYDFMVLNNAFLIHNPIRELKNQNENNPELVIRSKMLLSHEIKYQLSVLNGFNPYCFIV